MHRQFMILSNYLVNFKDDIADGALDNKKELGKKLVNYAVSLCEQGAYEEQDFNARVAYQKYS